MLSASAGGGPIGHVVDHDAGFLGPINAVLAQLPVDLTIRWHAFMILVAAALLVTLGALAAADRRRVPGKLRSLFEVFIVYLRDHMVRPLLGRDGDRFMPMLLTFFFLILTMNLLGMVPGLKTATGNIVVTGTLAVIAALFYHAMGIKEQGLIAYGKSMVPSGLGVLSIAMIPLEIIGHLVKPFALALRLFANMTAGHVVIGSILGFIFIAEGAMRYPVAAVSVLGCVALYFLELFVCFLQAFIFTFLVTVFLGGAVHPEH